MKYKILFLFISQLFAVQGLFAQETIVKGTVKDESGEPLIGVTVSAKDGSANTITNFDGEYSINSGKTRTLVFSYVGYKKQELIAKTNQLNVVLYIEENVLDDIIVVAYGPTSKAGFTGSASTITSKDISKSQVSSVSRLLQGSTSGVQSTAISGQPGSDASIYIRGIGSINASSTPLYVVDGAPFDGALNSINPADIESVNVLKDAASTALYGSRAGNGVVIITTKQGKKDEKSKIDLSFNYGVSDRAVKDYKQVSTDQYFQLYWEALRNQQMYINGLSPADAAKYASRNVVGNLGINPYGSKFPEPVGLDGKLAQGATPLWNDNWSDEYTQNAHRLETSVGISGGNKASTYYVSLNYLDDQGIALASDFKRYSGRLNLTTEVNKWLNLAVGISLTHSVQNAPKSDDTATANSLNFARMMPSFYPIWERNRETGAFIEKDGQRVIDYGSYRPSAASPYYNHLGSSVYDFQKFIGDVASIRTSAEIKLYKGLSYKGSVNIDYTNKNEHNYYNPVYGGESRNPIPGSVSKYNYRTTGFTGNNLLTYNTKIDDKHSIKFLLGQEYYEYNTTNFYGSRNGFPLLGFYEPDAASNLSSFGGKSDQYKLLSYFGNFEYNLSQKYYASASFRRDGSSRFSPQTRWGTFWSVGGSWRINEESFLVDVKNISKLSVRASYGGQGNDNIDYYAYKALFNINNNLGESGFVTSRLETPDLKWETNLNLNLGVDFALFDNRLNGSFEYFNRRSKDLLFEIPKPISTGYRSYPANAGALKNYGVEFSVTGTPVKTTDFKWDISLNATHYKNRITKLPQGQIISGNKLLRVGGSIYDFFLVEWAGIDPEDGLPQWYKTVNGERVKTKTYNEANTTASKILAGSSLPDLVGGFGTTLNYKGIELSALFAYSLGGKILNMDKLMIYNTGGNAGRAMSEDILHRWTPENTNTDVPRLQTSTANSWTNTSTRFLIDGDYLRMKNVTLGYDLPKSLLKKVLINRCKVFFQAENLITLFGEEGLDPEQNVNGQTYYRYPAMKSASLGVNLSF